MTLSISPAQRATMQRRRSEIYVLELMNFVLKMMGLMLNLMDLMPKMMDLMLTFNMY